MPQLSSSKLQTFDYVLIGSFVAFKVVLAAVAVPAHQADTALYVSMAKGFVEGASWISSVTWDGLPPGEMTRTAGYPVYLAGLWHLTGAGAYQAASLWVQSALTCVAFVMAYRVQKALVASRLASALFTVFAAASLGMLMDLSVLTDSLSGFLVSVVLLAVAGRMLGLWRLGTAALLALGAAFGFGVLVRPPNLYFTVLPAAGLIALAVQERRPVRTLVTNLSLFLAPLVLATTAHVAWNVQRAGVVGLSANGVYNWLWPLFHMDRAGFADPFAAGDEVDRAVLAKSEGQRNFPAIARTLNRLIVEYDGDWRALERRLKRKWLGTAARHPVAYAGTVLHTIDLPRLAFLLFEPRRSVRDLVNSHALGDAVPRVAGGTELRSRARAVPGVGTIAAVAFLFAGRTLALFMLACLLIAAPWSAVLAHRRGDRERALALGFLWLSTAVVVGAYGLIHFEDRMVAPVLLPALAAACAGPAMIWEAFRGQPPEPRTGTCPPR